MLGIKTARQKIDEKLTKPATTAVLMSIVAVITALVALLMSIRSR
jgi:hypothetical protein